MAGGLRRRGSGRPSGGGVLWAVSEALGDIRLAGVGGRGKKSSVNSPIGTREWWERSIGGGRRAVRLPARSLLA